ncbi:hypothetical protein QA649_37080 [Bradyrhizobium sp. CB1717]|uniref:hypothetical protein n=1 Tax=Bradyrhizobium sp. CB1717 TaxID=3039154 RepID=UPI0024B199D1|nr:hypothetical protein [Bradyrhizobium sp. CB1717]WFU23576.1 hypothetical protein QA649_37080 [Bradyrhizobium sp. CB1717]
MYRIALILGLLISPAAAQQIPDAEAIKLQTLGYKAEIDIRKHFESKHMKVTAVEMIWACNFKDVECTANTKFKFTGRALVVLPRGNRQVADCEATVTPEETDIGFSCQLFKQNFRFNKDECAVMAEYFRYCATEDPINDVKCYPADVMYPGLRWGHNSLLAIAQRHHLPYGLNTVEEGVFDGLCKKVCQQKTSALQALRKFCPRTKL